MAFLVRKHSQFSQQESVLLFQIDVLLPEDVHHISRYLMLNEPGRMGLVLRTHARGNRGSTNGFGRGGAVGARFPADIRQWRRRSWTFHQINYWEIRAVKERRSVFQLSPPTTKRAFMRAQPKRELRTTTDSYFLVRNINPKLDVDLSTRCSDLIRYRYHFDCRFIFFTLSDQSIFLKVFLPVVTRPMNFSRPFPFSSAQGDAIT